MADSTTGGGPHQEPYPHFSVQLEPAPAPDWVEHSTGFGDNRHRGHFGEQFVWSASSSRRSEAAAGHGRVNPTATPVMHRCARLRARPVTGRSRPDAGVPRGKP